MRKKSLYVIALVIGLAIAVGSSTNSLADDFYKGKIIRFVVGYAPGGGYDTTPGLRHAISASTSRETRPP